MLIHVHHHYTDRAEMTEVVVKGHSQHTLHVSRAEQIEAEGGAIVEQAPLEVALEGRVSARVTPGEPDLNHPTTRLDPGLIPE